jgi:hypothetical protein
MVRITADPGMDLWSAWPCLRSFFLTRRNYDLVQADTMIPARSLADYERDRR